MTDDIKDLIKRLSYDPETGVLTWIEGRRKGKNVGTIVDGYLKLKFKGKCYFAHRIIWHMVHGACDGMIDHINRVRTDNRLINLRLSNQTLNSQNRGALCVYRRPYSRWEGGFGQAGKYHYCGTYSCPLLAGLAVKERKLELGILTS